MQENATTVHGSIFFLLKKFVDNSFPEGVWEKLITEAGATGQYELTAAYPLEEIGKIVSTASALTGISAHNLQERFGEYLVPDLFKLYASYLMPAWRTFEVLLHTEGVMHGAVRKLNSTAHPPILNVTKVSNQLLIIDYYSRRKMGSLAVGIIKGIAKFFNEEDRITVIPTTNPDAERVQIRVEFQ